MNPTGITIIPGGTIPLPAVMKGDFYAWATKRYISGIELKIKDLEKEIAANTAEMARQPAWTKELAAQNAYFEARILEHRAEIAALLAKPFTADQFAEKN